MKKIVTVSFIVLVALGLGFYLFSISPEPVSSYNSLINISGSSQISTPPPFNPSTDHYLGNPQAKNIFIEYADLQCPACAAFKNTLKQVPEKFTDTVFVYRHFPLVRGHQNTVIAALAAEAANAQGKFWEMEELLFEKQVEWQNVSDPLELFAGYAQQAGVSNIEQFKSDITSHKHLAAVQKNADEAYGMDLQGTPTLFFNGKQLQAVNSVDALKAQAEALLNK